MNKNTHRLLSLLLAFVMIVIILPVSAIAEIGTNEYGSITFTTFEELKELCSQSSTVDSDEYVELCYVGTAPLVFKEDLFIPANITLLDETLTSDRNHTQQFIIPVGVTITLADPDYYISRLYVNDLTVDGTLICNGLVEVFSNLAVTGQVQIKSDKFYIYYDAELTGSENIVYDSGCFLNLDCYVQDMNGLNTVLDEALACTNPNWMYWISLQDYEEDFVITESVLIPKNVVLISNNLRISSDGALHLKENAQLYANSIVVDGTFDIYRDASVALNQSGSLIINNYAYILGELRIDEDDTLEVNGALMVYAPLIVAGTLVNNSEHFNILAGAGELNITESGTYSGSGYMRVHGLSSVDPYTAISGIDLTQFTVTQEPNDECGCETSWKFENTTEPEPTDPPVALPTLTGTYTTDLVMPAADLGVSAPDSVLRATLTFGEDGSASCVWEAVDLTAFRIFFHDMFVNAYYAMAYGAGITDLAEIERFCMESTGLSVSDYMDTLVTDQAMIESFTPVSTSGTYSYNADHTAILTDLAIMEVPSDPSVENSFVLGGNTLYLNAASWDKPDYTFVCTGSIINVGVRR